MVAALVGVVSRHDVLRVSDRPDREVKARLDELLASPRWAPEGHHVTAQVVDGVVRLSGSIRYPSDARVVAGLATQVPGVIEVRTDLTAEQPEPKPSYFKDTDWC
jgi:osmotically-inducible protein OsmY